MSYTPRPNASGDTLVSSRDPIRTNFVVLQDRFDENHVNLDGGAGGGKHKFLQMPDQASDPATVANEVGVFAKTDGSGVSQLYIKGESSGSTYQLTKIASGVDANIATFGTNTNYNGNNNGGWTFLPGGLILQYGRRTSPGSSGTIVFPLAFPSGNPPFSITISNERGSARSSGVRNTGITDAQFNYFLETSGSTAVNWVAIGN